MACIVASIVAVVCLLFLGFLVITAGEED